jgi:hypothetical protein
LAFVQHALEFICAGGEEAYVVDIQKTPDPHYYFCGFV